LAALVALIVVGSQTVLVTTQAHAALPTLANPGFESGQSGWSFGPNAGVTGTNVHSGRQAGYINAGGGSISQTLTADADRVLEVSAWVSTSGPGASLSAAVGSAAPAQQVLGVQSTYQQIKLAGINVKKGETVTVAFGAPTGGAITIDDVQLDRDGASAIPNPALVIGAVRIAASSGGCIDDGSTDSRPAPVRLASCGLVSPTQLWRVLNTSATPRATGAAQQFLNVGTGRCLAVAGSSPSPGARMVTISCQPAASPEQLFTAATIGDFGQVMPANSTLCIDAKGTGLTQQACSDSAAQQWRLDDGGLSLVNSGFENGTTGWTFTGNTGVVAINAHTGHGAAELASAADSLDQTVTSVGGVLQLAAWISSTGPDANMTVRVNGSVAAALRIPTWNGYQRYSVGGIDTRAGDRVEVQFSGASSGRTDIDDVYLDADHAEITVSSSDQTATDLFTWAKAQANNWVIQDGASGPLNVDERNPSGTGTGTYRASYWAGYKYRTGFYGRDTAHQVVGAHLLGLDLENKNMLRALIASATPARGGYPVWSINFDTSTPLAIDYKSDTNFVRELPTVFELVQKSDEAFQWTGDKDYVLSNTMWSYYLNAVSAFIASHNGRIPNGQVQVAEGTDGNIFDSVASYNENGATLIEAGDAIASQYQAYLSFADLAAARGDLATSSTYKARAASLRVYFNNSWSKYPGTTDLVRGYQLANGQPVAVLGWGKENSIFMPLKGIVAAGSGLDSYLAAIDANETDPAQQSPNIEALTYLPDTFFANEQNDLAWKWMQYIYAHRAAPHVNARQGANGTYPEVSFTLVSQTITGLLGLTPSASATSLTTQSRLPSGMSWLKADNVPIGADRVSLRQEQYGRSTLTNSSGPTTLSWTVRFDGAHRTIDINGSHIPARQTRLGDGTLVSEVTVSVRPGQSVTAVAH
jgi:hypothetical protein